MGTSKISQTLSVGGDAVFSGNISIENGAAELILKDTTDDDDFRILFQNNSSQTIYSIDGSGDTFNLETNTTRSLKLRTNDTDAVEIICQNVGIGTTSPNTKLHIYSGASGYQAGYYTPQLRIEDDVKAGSYINTPYSDTHCILGSCNTI